MEDSEDILIKYKNIVSEYEEKKDFNNAINFIDKILQHTPDDKKIIFKKAELLLLNGKIQESYNITFELLKNSPNDISLLKLCANQQYYFENHNVRIKIFERIINNAPNDIDGYIGITSSFIYLKKYKDAINYSTKGIEIDPYSQELYNNLIVSLIQIEDFEKAFEYIKIFEKNNPLSNLIPSYGIFLNEQLNKNYQFQYYQNPYDYIKEYKFDDKNNFIKNFYDLISNIPKEWEPQYKTTIKGSQTDNNLFYEYKDNREIKIFINFINKTIKDYKEFYKNSKDLYIKELPDLYSLNGWAVSLKSSGYQESHNHSNAWVSGVFYIKVPKKNNKNDGDIVFSTHGYDFPKISAKVSQKIINVKEGNLVIFPSCLYHKTIPFESKNDRLSIAFDISRIKN